MSGEDIWENTGHRRAKQARSCICASARILEYVVLKHKKLHVV